MSVTNAKEFLRSLDLYITDNQFNYVAYLLADNNSVSMKIAKYAGTNKTDLVENVEFGYCSIIKATHNILDKLSVENKTFVKITGEAERLQKQMIDKTALREALINAVVHNDYTAEVPPVVEIYSDRLSITSYGGLGHGLSEEEFFEGRSMPRNRELMRIYRDLRLVEQLGSGIHRILKAYDRSVFKLSDNFLEISFPFEQDYNNYNDSGSQNKLGKDNSGLVEGLADIQGRLSEVPTDDIKKAVYRMVENELLSIAGAKRNRTYDLVKKNKQKIKQKIKTAI